MFYHMVNFVQVTDWSST